MAYIHSKGIAHLDLKTTNILLSQDLRFTLIADFGISQMRDGNGSAGVGGGHGSGSHGGRGPAIRGDAAVNPVFEACGGVVEMSRFDSVSSVDSLGAAGGLAFTPQYCAPERLLRNDLAFVDLLASDVYTFGMLRR